MYRLCEHVCTLRTATHLLLHKHICMRCICFKKTNSFRLYTVRSLQFLFHSFRVRFSMSITLVNWTPTTIIITQCIFSSLVHQELEPIKRRSIFKFISIDRVYRYCDGSLLRSILKKIIIECYWMNMCQLIVARKFALVNIQVNVDIPMSVLVLVLIWYDTCNAYTWSISSSIK